MFQKENNAKKYWLAPLKKKKNHKRIQTEELSLWMLYNHLNFHLHFELYRIQNNVQLNYVSDRR